MQTEPLPVLKELPEEERKELTDLQQRFFENLSDLDEFQDYCDRVYNARRNQWAGKSYDYRKWGEAQFPWDGCSDQEVFLIEEKIQTYVALCMTALRRANLRAYPVEGGDIRTAKLMSSFLKWMRQSYIRGFHAEMERDANHMLESTMAVSYIGWERKVRPTTQTITLQQLAELDPALAQAVRNPDAESDVVDVLQQFISDAGRREVRRYVKELREQGFTEVKTTEVTVDRPLVESLSPTLDFMMPSYTKDVQDAPVVYWRQFVTEPELRNKAIAEGLDETWVDHVVNRFKGYGYDENELEAHRRLRNSDITLTNDLIEIVYAYSRETDDNNAESIFLTVFSPHLSTAWGKREQTDLDEYPFVVTPFLRDQHRVYEGRSMAGMLMGLQWQIKAERDSRIDTASLAISPPKKKRMGNETIPWHPGAEISVADTSDLDFADAPPPNPASERVEAMLMRQADLVTGTAADLPESQVKQQFFVDRFLEHCKEVLSMAFRSYQRNGPEEIAFRVMGTTEPMRMVKDKSMMKFDLMLHFDVAMFDRESVDTKLQQFVSLLQLDRTGKVNVEALIELLANMYDPVLADMIIQPAEEGYQKIVAQVMEDITKIYSGMEVGARPQGAQIAMQVLGQYVNQPDIQARMQEDEGFAERLQKYIEQYQFQLQQMQNAQIGRIGTAPATFQGMNQ